MSTYVAWVVSHWVLVVAITLALGTAFDGAAKIAARFGYTKIAHVLAAVAELLPQAVGFVARMLAMGTGKPFELPPAPSAALPPATPPSAPSAR